MKKTILTLLAIVAMATLTGCNTEDRLVPKYENDKVFSSQLSESMITSAGAHKIVITGTASDETVKIKLPANIKGKLCFEDNSKEGTFEASKVVGDYSVKFNADDLAPGHYIIELESKGGSPKFIVSKRTETLVVDK